MATLPDPRPESASQPPPHASLRFERNGDPVVDGQIVPEGTVLIDYDLDRLPQCRAAAGQVPTWQITAYVRLIPETRVVQHPLTSLTGSRLPVTAGRAQCFLEIPYFATGIEICFHNSDDTRCTCWDNNRSSNYYFPVAGAAAYDATAVPPLPEAATRLDLVNLWDQRATLRSLTSRLRTSAPGAEPSGLYLHISAWVRNVAFHKRVFADICVLSRERSTLFRRSLTLAHVAGDGGSGDFFELERLVLTDHTSTHDRQPPAVRRRIPPVLRSARLPLHRWRAPPVEDSRPTEFLPARFALAWRLAASYSPSSTHLSPSIPIFDGEHFGHIVVCTQSVAQVRLPRRHQG